ncbi:MAG: DUF305 domain-containing protein [Candidatus Levybacteria bacterium]|nr:DUF305 domain-containing protein [Candidatus Levybacteria bacterium]
MKQNDKLIYGIVGALIGGIIVWFVAGNVANGTMMGTRNQNNMSNTSQGNMMAGNIDRRFIEQMIPHHESAITMAKLAQTKAQRPEVKQLANNIIDSQGKEIILMEDWYKTWYGSDVPKSDQAGNQHGMMGNNSGMMGDSSDMTKLEQAEDFDKVFVEEMIPHHQMAVMMATMLKSGTERIEMKKLADDISKSQTQEIDQMQQWLNDWEK